MKNQSGTAVLALIVAIIALIIGWTAYNRAGQNSAPLVQQEVQEAMMELGQEYEEFEDGAQEAAREASDESAEVLYEGSVELDTDGNLSE